MTHVFAEVNELSLGVFSIVIAITLGITFWAAKRSRTAEGFFTAERSITGGQNGFAISGDFMSASTFLGVTGLVFLVGMDGTLILVSSLLSFLVVLFLIAERMRNAGKFTTADVLAFRLRERPARTAAAVNTLTIAGLYLMAQLLGAGVLIQALAGISFPLAVVITGTFMIIYVVFGGMLATTWVQIVKAGLLLACGFGLLVAILIESKFSISSVLTQATERHPEGDAILSHGLLFPTDNPLDTISYVLTFALGTAGLPHILIRFFTVPDAQAARKSVVWATVIIGSFYLIVVLIGYAARAYLPDESVTAAGESGNLAGPLLAQEFGGGAGSVGGDIALALVSAVAFATILAVVAGLVISASGAVAHDLWSNVIRKGRVSDDEEVKVARVSSIALGVIAIVLTVIVGAGTNITVLVALAFSVAASANFPPLLLALSWRRFNTMGAVVGAASGLIASLVVIFLGPNVMDDPVINLSQTAIISVPIGFLGCWLGTMLSEERGAERSYHEMLVRSETGIGAEEAHAITKRARTKGEPEGVS
jgi:cation/acetate symporter